MMRIGSLFSGIGGLELGLEWSGLGHTVWQVEQSEFCRLILERHWPDVERFDDVCTVGKHNLSPVDVICGGFPCQDISGAGKGAGLAGERSGLWFQFARVIGELRPRWVVVENVASGARRWVDQVTAGLGQLGFQTLPLPLSAANVEAPHLRRRVFLIAHAVGEPLRVEQGRRGGAGGQGAPEPGHDGEARTPPGSGWVSWEGWRPPVPPVCGVDDGVPDRVDRLKALGNSVVPQCAEVVGWVIRELEASSE